MDGIDPERLAAALAVFADLEQLPPDHPDVLAARRATASLYKQVKVARRSERRAAKTAHDAAVTAATATGAPGRIDDETAGAFGLTTETTTESAGELLRSRSCYTCKQRYTTVDAFYHQLCPACAAFNRAKRDARTDLSGRRALLTGGRAKIGMYIALRLLRDGAHTTITTRFPTDATRRFAAMPDSAEWLHRLRIIGIDLRDPAQVLELADAVAAEGPLDILINNACQTVRRTPGAYAQLIAAETAELPLALPGKGPDVLSIGRFTDVRPKNVTALAQHAATMTADEITQLALTGGSSSLDRVAAGVAIDAGGLVPDLDAENSWSRVVDQIDPLEMLEVQLCNMTAPFLLVSKLRASLASSPARRKYVVNVSAMEGQFGRQYKGPGHPHTNMAKAALNMLTKTSA
ncbi:MAG TPA: SDR family NAD(P)-dependent oxidoreductase, partial [Mycobacteriales bacterium]|nr:SDR family NAD(P)-dependent oxidoreductase [Mycobacteriales bacterium]